MVESVVVEAAKNDVTTIAKTPDNSVKSHYQNLSASNFQTASKEAFRKLLGIGPHICKRGLRAEECLRNKARAGLITHLTRCHSRESGSLAGHDLDSRFRGNDNLIQLRKANTDEPLSTDKKRISGWCARSVYPFHHPLTASIRFWRRKRIGDLSLRRHPPVARAFANADCAGAGE